MLRVYFYFIFMLFFLAGVYLNCLGRWIWQRFFCKSKDFKAFLRCSCVHFFKFVFRYNSYYYLYFYWFAKREEKVCFLKGSMFWVENEGGIHL